MLYLLASGPVLAATLNDPIIASGSGVTVDRTLENDTTQAGTVTAEDNGMVTIDIRDTSGISGSLTADRNGVINLKTYDNAFISGNLSLSNGGDAEMELNDNTVYSGNITVTNSGGVLNLAMNGNASVTGHIYGGSSTTNYVVLSDTASITGGVEANAGGTIAIVMSGNTLLSGGIASEQGNSHLYLTTTENVVINSPVDVFGSGEATLTFYDNTAFTGDMSITGSGTLNLNASNNSTLQGNLLTSGGGKATVVFNEDVTMVGNVTTDPGGSTTMTLNDRTSLTGDATTGAGTTFNLTLNGSSTFTGASVINWGNANISLNGAGTSWYVTQSKATSGANGATGSQYASAVSNLSLADGAWVYLGAKNYTMNGMADRVQLDILNLTGNGNFELRLHVAGMGTSAYNDGDLIHVTNTAGSHNIYIPSAQLGLGGVAVNGQEILKVVHSIDGGGQFSLYQNKLVDIGHYTYKLVQQGTHWYLISDGSVPDENGGTDPGGNQPPPVTPLPPDLTNVDPGFGVIVNPLGPDINRPAETSANFMTANYLITYIELQTLLQRMGDLRHCREGDIWVRGFAGGMNSKQFHQLSSFSMHYYGVQMGADKNIRSISENFFMGVMAGYTHGNPRHNQADSSIESFHAGLYGLYGTEDDFYVDATAKVSHVRNKYTTTNSGGERVVGKGSGNALILGLEAGKRFYFSECREGFYIEPQVQGIYTHQNDVPISADNGLISRMDGYNSVLVRAGGLIGYNVKGGSTPVNVYAKGGYVRELTADVDVHYNRMRHNSYNYKGGWYEVGVGVTTEFKDRHALYMDFEYESGKRFNKRQVNLGYRFAF